MPLLVATTCPDSLLDDAHTHGSDRPPTPDVLTYSLTLPASATSPAIARRAVAAILQAHGLRELTEAAVLVTAELTACAYRFTPTEEVYLRLRHRDEDVGGGAGGGGAGLRHGLSGWTRLDTLSRHQRSSRT
ncbi:hypothetical protein [Streptomyces lasiicapitis]|uniref:hypothetical protein n=1 Tax=Streptomyces lasiicapitis TaxID=1923961 RepID=UPI0036667AF1